MTVLGELIASVGRELRWLALVGVAFMALESLRAFRPSRASQPRRTYLRDLLYSVSNTAVEFVTVLIGTALPQLWLSAMPNHLLAPLHHWMQVQSLFVQVSILLVVGDVAGYCIHRMMHSRGLWRIHAIHHNSRALYWLAANRGHPLGRVLSIAIQAACIGSLGSPHAASVAGTLAVLYGHFIHADLRVTYGPLERVFVSPRIHHWHHATDKAGQGKNFAGMFAFLDWLGGTLYLPPAMIFPSSYGSGEPALADTFVSEMLFPLRRHSQASREKAAERSAAD